MDNSLHREDGVAFKKAVHAYHTHRLSEAIEHLTYLINTYPSGSFTEKAYFLLASTYVQYYAKDLSVHFETIKSHYENAIFNFPDNLFDPFIFYS